MNAKHTSPASQKASRRDEMIALAREIRGEFAKIHAQMANILARSQKKAA